jgi:FlaG/FlaF family flagellin (archaellin)
MHFQKRLSRKNGDDGISPVVGVMLMLVVTIIIAAVVSAFAGGSMTGSQKAPTANVEFHLKNTGNATTSYFSMKVLGVSEPIPTKNLKIITSFSATNRTDGGPVNITGATSSAGKSGVYITDELTDLSGTTSGAITVPTGYGNGVTVWANDTVHPQDAMWGNFVLSSGTSTFDRPVAYGTAAVGSFLYPDGHDTDPMQSILGAEWNNLKAGDTVAVRIVDVKSGKTIVDQNVIVEG